MTRLVTMANQTGSQLTSTLVDFDSEITNNVEVALNTAKVSNVDHPLVEAAVPVGALFTDTDTIYDDTAIQAEVTLNTAKVSFPEAPVDTKQYARVDAGWAEVVGGGFDSQVLTEVFSGFSNSTVDISAHGAGFYIVKHEQDVTQDPPIKSSEIYWAGVGAFAENIPHTTRFNHYGLRVSEAGLLSAYQRSAASSTENFRRISLIERVG